MFSTVLDTDVRKFSISLTTVLMKFRYFLFDSHWWCCKFSKFHITSHKMSRKVRSGDRGSHWISCFYATTKLSKISGNLNRNARSLWPEPHLASTINVETYYFQIGCLRNLPTVVKQNYLICHYSCLCLHYHKKYGHNRMPVPLIPLETVTTWYVSFLQT